MLRLTLALAGLALASAGCHSKPQGSTKKAYTAVAKTDDDRFCPKKTDTFKCNQYEQAPCQLTQDGHKCAKFCESDGECRTVDINNCWNTGNKAEKTKEADIYLMEECKMSVCTGSNKDSKSDDTDKSSKGKCKHKKNIILAAGDSLTYGRHGKNQLSCCDGTYPAHLQDMFDKKTNYNVKVVNAGESGATAQPFGYNPYACVWDDVKGATKTCSKMGGYDVFEASIKEASVVIVMLGTNDAKTKWDPVNWPNTGEEGMWDGDGKRYQKYYIELLEKMKEMAGGDDCTKFFVGLSPPQMCTAPFQDGYEPRGSGGAYPEMQGCVGTDITRDWGPFTEDEGDEDGWMRINYYLSERQQYVADQLGFEVIDFRQTKNGDVYDKKSDTFVAIAAETRETRADSVHFTEIGYRNLAERAYNAIYDYIEEEAPPALLVAKEPSLYDYIAVKVPTLVAVVFMAAFALGALAMLLLRGSRDAAAEPLLRKDVGVDTTA